MGRHWLSTTPAVPPPPLFSPGAGCPIPPCRRKFGEETVGFRYVASGPLVRSSYRAGEFFTEAMVKGDRQLAAGAAAAAAAAPAPDAAPALFDIAGMQVELPQF